MSPLLPHSQMFIIVCRLLPSCTFDRFLMSALYIRAWLQPYAVIVQLQHPFNFSLRQSRNIKNLIEHLW